MKKMSITFVIASVITLLVKTIDVSAAVIPSNATSGDYSSSDVVALLLYIFLALFFSFLCSIAEAVLLNITPSYIADLQDKNPFLADRVKNIRSEKVDESLAAILTMNTIAHTVGAIGSGAKATIVFGSVWFGVFSAIMTLLILFLSEIIPKTVGVVYWRKLVPPVIKYIEILSFVLFPFVLVSETITRAIAKDQSIHGFNRDEFVALAGVGEEAGVINNQESTIIQNLFRLGSLTVEDILTPRPVIMGFDQKKTVSEVLNYPGSLSFSRIIVHEGNLDKITGFILKDELLLLKAQNKGNTPIEKLKRDIIAVSLSYPVSKLLEKLLKVNQHIALIVDEFGTKGIVTVEDILETLLGIEIVDESDSVDDMRVLARNQWESRMETLGMDPHFPLEDESELGAKNEESEISEISTENDDSENNLDS